MTVFKRDRFLKIVSEYARGMMLKEIARLHAITAVRVKQIVGSPLHTYRDTSQGKPDKRRRYAQQRRVQFELLQEYPNVFKEVMSEGGQEK